MQTVSRLTAYFTPEHYQLSLSLDRPQRTFSGLVTLTGELLDSSAPITVHAKDLDIASVLVDGKRADFSLGEDDELSITHPELVSGRHIVVIAFSGVITDAMHGLYPCYYEHDGVKKELLATQFESHHAREVFPCIDEPAAKATFDVTLTTEQDVTVLGNMPVASSKVEDERLVTSFQTTPRMSTYLLAWVVGELHKKTASTKHGVEVNVWATPAQSPASLDFALDIAVRSIDFYNDYFGVAYPLPKSDHVALPDFSSGAMENWGLITYREIALLADPATTSVSSRHYIATVIAHELAHQWFGNLVTMEWWNDLWLNESFATLMEYIAVDALEPDWNIWLDFATNESLLALRRDSIDGVQAVQVDVHHPDEISTLFDGAIVYAKGARLLHMLESYVGKRDFKAGLQDYFKQHAYQNTTARDLWQAIARASGKDIAGLMHQWIAKPGYPVVTASLKNTDTIHLSQKQFFVGPHRPSDTIWPIPLEATTSDLPSLMKSKELEAPRTSTGLLRLNDGDSAHFITNYDQSLLEAIIKSLKDGQLSPLDRLQLLDEQTLLARGNVIPSANLIGLLGAYKHETTEAVWDIIGAVVGELKKFVETDEAARAKLRALSGSLASSLHEKLGWQTLPGEDESSAKLRATLISMMLYSEDETVIRTANGEYSSKSIEELDGELRSLILSTVVRHGDNPSTFDTLLNLYQETASSELRQDLCVALTATRDPGRIGELLGTIKNADIIRPQDASHWFVYLIRNYHARTQTWQWLRDNWQWVVETFGGDKSYDDFPRYAAGALNTAEQLQEYKAFFEPLKNESALTRVISVGISEIEGRVALIERDGPAVRQALLDL